MLKTYVEFQEPNYQDGAAESLIEMLLNAYIEFNGFDQEIIREDFGLFYTAMNGKTLHEMDQIVCTVCTLCRNHEKSSFVEGEKVGIRLKKNWKLCKNAAHRKSVRCTL